MAVARLGDIDGDGQPDFAIGEPGPCPSGAFNGPGSVYLVSGRTGLVVRTLSGAEDLDRFGAAVADLGDVDGDGLSDIVVGAPGAQAGGLSTGAVSVFSGASGALLWRTEAVSGDGDFGYSLVNVGDVNADGTADVAVGAPHSAGPSNSNVGLVRILSGATGAPFAALSSNHLNSEFGAALAMLGDVNGDSKADLLVGAPEDSAGIVTIFDPTTWLPIRALAGTAAGSAFGWAATSVGDIDGDGRDDLAVGAPSSYAIGGTPKVLVYSGGTGIQLKEFDGPTFSRFGEALASGDFDGDGEMDLVVGAPGEGDLAVRNVGSISLFRSLQANPAFQARGLTGYEEMGRCVVRLNDVNGDGRSDFLVGAPGAVHLGTSPVGVSYVYGYADVRAARAFCGSGGGARTSPNSSTVYIELEPIASDFAIGDLQNWSITLRPATGDFREIRPRVVDVSTIADSDDNGVAEARLGFSLEDWRSFFGSLDKGTTVASLSIDGNLTGGARLSAPLTLDVYVPAPFEATVFPNPAKATATISFRTTAPGDLRVRIFDCAGRRVRDLYGSEAAPAGYYDLVFDGRSDRDNRLPTGVYYYKISGTTGQCEGRFLMVR